LAITRIKCAESGQTVASRHAVEVCESTFYNVRVADELEAWLKRSGGAPRDVAMRQRVRSGLNSGGD
jgi:hypothetical protein